MSDSRLQNLSELKCILVITMDIFTDIFYFYFFPQHLLADIRGDQKILRGKRGEKTVELTEQKRDERIELERGSENETGSEKRRRRGTGRENARRRGKLKGNGRGRGNGRGTESGREKGKSGRERGRSVKETEKNGSVREERGSERGSRESGIDSGNGKSAKEGEKIEETGERMSGLSGTAVMTVR